MQLKATEFVYRRMTVGKLLLSTYTRMMGEEIYQQNFEEKDYERFHQRLVEETEFVRSLFAQRAFDNQTRKLGYEVELCLVDKKGQPSKLNHEVIGQANNPLLTTELAKFNLEINGHPFELSADVFDRIEADLSDLYQQVEKAANKFDARSGLFGVLPSLSQEHLSTDGYMSELNRYDLLSRQLMKMRGKPVVLDLKGEDHLIIEKNDVMLEALSTSLQVHLQVPFDEIVPAYHAGLWSSMLILGASPNSPLIFGKSCWQESRIGIFQQAVDTRNVEEIRDGIVPRVHFGKGYIESLFELFEDNFYYSPILPEVVDKPTEALHHFNLHNGTIWRWVRPILGQNSLGEYHLRLELRVVPSGPTLIDTIANLVFYVGLTEGLIACGNDLTQLDFTTLEIDFYAAARDGMNARVHWIDGNQDSLKRLILSHALPLAQTGLSNMGVENTDKWLDIIAERVSSEQTGAHWIMQHWKQHADTDKMVRTYLRHAVTNTPVHLWPKP
jgi:gamma-glutamyl:cysteine ligase YbdK (ATP-grasp superfamily)